MDTGNDTASVGTVIVCLRNREENDQLTQLLHLNGFVVRTAQNQEEAYQQVISSSTDVVFVAQDDTYNKSDLKRKLMNTGWYDKQDGPEIILLRRPSPGDEGIICVYTDNPDFLLVRSADQEKPEEMLRFALRIMETKNDHPEHYTL